MRERESQTDRHIDRQTDRQTDREAQQRDRGKEIKTMRFRERQKGRWRGR